jgi:D-alanyl-D-alanine carboxypeptidase/D-alanyl-D-alanine-endopeptidase (penicillin-binding protein 4)
MNNNMKNRISAASRRALSLCLVLSLALVNFAVAAEAAPRSHPKSHAHFVRRVAVANEQGVEIIDAHTGAVITSTNETLLFNPASNTKLLTTLMVLQKFGPDYRFPTEIRADGTVDSQGVLHGDLYVDGQYMLFGDDQAKELAKLLNDRGIKAVTGNLYVSSAFSMDLNTSGSAAGAKLLALLDPQHAQVRALRRHKHAAVVPPPATPYVSIIGGVKVGAPPVFTRLLASHYSPPVKDIIKIMLCYSDNTMAQKFGVMVGGAAALNKFVLTLGVAPGEATFATTSGLDINRVTPRAMVKIVQALKSELEKDKLTLADLLPVAGIDDGTMAKRLNGAGEAGSVIAKTGTLTETDQGVAALSGEIFTTGGGEYLFVIFDMHGDVLNFRKQQDNLVLQFQQTHGGAQAIVYTPILPRIDSEDYWR